MREISIIVRGSLPDRLKEREVRSAMIYALTTTKGVRLSQVKDINIIFLAQEEADVTDMIVEVSNLPKKLVRKSTRRRKVRQRFGKRIALALKPLFNKNLMVRNAD